MRNYADEAMGLIETLGMVPAIYGADAMLKAADVEFIGSDTMMVAPVNIGANVTVGAGSVITKDVPDDALAVARARESVYDGWTLAHRK